MARKKEKEPVGGIPAEVRACLDIANDAEGKNRQDAINALEFSNGKQWPAEIQMQRQMDKRPCLVINKTDTFVRNVVNNMRQQRPRIQVHPVGDGADQNVAEVIEGLVRHIEVSSNAEVAYDTASDFQVRIGWGYWRIVGRYIDDESFVQELYIERIRNPFSVYFDPSSVEPDGSDAQWCVITGKMKLAEFRKKYPKATETGITALGGGDSLADWAGADEIMLAEFYKIEEEADDLLRLSDGRTVWKTDVTEEDLLKKGVVSVDARPSMRKRLKWYKVSATEILEERTLVGKHIPVIPVYGGEQLDNGKVIRFGMVKNLMDPQRMYNYWRSQETEFVALAPKAPWLMAEGQDEGHENEWDSANIKNYSRLVYKPVTDENGQTLPPPERMMPQQIPAASVNAAMGASEDIKAVAGMFDPALGAPGQETSGKMVLARQSQSDMSNFHFYDNLTRSIRWTGKLLLEWIPFYYDTYRTIRILGADGKPKSVEINKDAVDKVLNDLTVGRYDVVMETGPGYDTKRQEAAAMMTDMLRFMPQLGQVAGDVIVGQMDWPGAKLLAERLAMANPLSQIDKQLPENLPPEVKTMLAHMMAQNQQLQQELQQLSLEKQARIMGLSEKEQLVTQRTQMQELSETHRLHVREAGENTRAALEARTRLEQASMNNAADLRMTMIDASADLTLGHMRDINRGQPKPQ